MKADEIVRQVAEKSSPIMWAVVILKRGDTRAEDSYLLVDRASASTFGRRVFLYQGKTFIACVDVRLIKKVE